jgi:hypothetical protein
MLIAVFELYPHRAIRINLLISLATLAVSAMINATSTWVLESLSALTAGGLALGNIGICVSSL